MLRTSLDNSGLIVVEKIEDVEPILERNKQLKSEEQAIKWGRHEASVPDVIVTKWLDDEYKRGNTELRFLGPGFDKWFDKKLQDPDNRAWRVDNPSNPFHVGWGK